LIPEIGLVDISLEPFGHVADGEYPECLGRVGGGLQLGVVVDDIIALVCKFGVVIFALE
jgi:hypothetical protein